MLASKAEKEKLPLLATIFLFTARFGDYNFEKLKLVGEALELIELAVEEHYPVRESQEKKESASSDEFSDNLSLITGDYYYSRAIMLVAGLRDVSIIRVLAETVATIAEAMTFAPSSEGKPKEIVNRYMEWIDKITALYVASPRLAAYLSNLSEDLKELFESFGRALGGFFYANQYLPSDLPDKVRETIIQNYVSVVQEKLNSFRELGLEVEEVPLTVEK